MFKTKLLCSLLISLASNAHAASNAQSKFENHLRWYFAGFSGGRDVVNDIYYTASVDADYTRANRTDRPMNGEPIEFELAYVRVFGSLICRVGIGYASMSRVESDVDPAVLAECVPIQTERPIVDEDLSKRFARSRETLLGSKISRWRDMQLAEVPPDATTVSFQGLSPRLQAVRLFWFDAGPKNVERPPDVRAVYAGRLTTTYNSGESRTRELTGDLWQANFMTLGHAVNPRQPLAMPVITQSCREALWIRFVRFFPG